jgi:hypothetical protein
MKQIVKHHARVWYQRPLIAALLCFSSFVLHPSSLLVAAPTQEDVFRSISNNVGPKPGEGGKGLAVLLCGAGGLILLVLLAGSRARRQAVPQPLNHSRKLMREVMKAVPLRRGEIKQLKLLADAAGADGGAGPVESPLTLLLCPSVLARALKNRPSKVDRAVIARVVKRMGLAQGAPR